MELEVFHCEVFYRFLNKYVISVSRNEVKRGLGMTVREIFDSVGVPKVQPEGLFPKLNAFVVRKWML